MCGRTQLEVIRGTWNRPECYLLWQRFQDDGNVSKCYSAGRPPSVKKRRMRDWHLAVTAAKKQTGAQHQTKPRQPSATGTTVSRQTVYRRLGTLVHARSSSDASHLPQLTVACDFPRAESMHCGHRNSGLV
ncbi:hypothetical protein AVEN_63378-1 [Araneus ventricosus]|uniref:Transposase Tc1-like domain-containing protein n=1 Tax=Araneus ventricosus TaxID=182803 RepID=A0A4Y2QTJ1_ARAVE|nr:hypothetical protein AVEN_63378-1 [Araneus ventricosus]